MEYDDKVILLLFCEGTRLTKEKYEASVKFSQEKGLPVMKHHLQPRTKGFALCLERMKQVGKCCVLNLNLRLLLLVV